MKKNKFITLIAISVCFVYVLHIQQIVRPHTECLIYQISNMIGISASGSTFDISKETPTVKSGFLVPKIITEKTDKTTKVRILLSVSCPKNS